MSVSASIKNWANVSTAMDLGNIDHHHVNIAFYDRDIVHLQEEIKSLINQQIELRISGEIESISNKLKFELSQHKFIANDIYNLLHIFQGLTEVKSFRLLLATINTNMCRKFHTDINDLRLLCTYSGPGTLWLTEDNVNRNALNSCGDNECIVLDESKIQQAKTASVVILKGAMYSKEGTKAIVHRSPTIQEAGEKRLLLSIDTN